MELTRKNVKRIVENRLCADLNNRISYVNCVHRWTMYNSLPLQRPQFVFSISLSPRGNKRNLQIYYI